MKILSAEWLKTKRTFIRWFAFLTPIGFAVLILWYFSLRAITPDIQVAIYMGNFLTWTGLIIPVEAGLISGLIVHQEEVAGSFNGFLGSKVSKSSLYLGKLTILVLFSLCSTLLETIIIVAGTNYILNIPVSWPIFLSAALMAVIGTLPLLALHLWISFAWGMGASIGFGCGGALISSLMITGLGDKIWQFVPWAWPARLSGLLAIYLPGIKVPSELSKFTLSQVFWLTTMKGLIPAGIFFIIMLVGGIIWFNRWEGRY
ncbi:lantibiotic immunity ABC transporter MutG family permease subunit [Aceticella autotrophica]|uniref:Lantibiotic immunity ABC transporter MutG family permease subunit n=1 Tax=Aceticella autotrophica TaxID=2755338 RepID=A0A975AW00_9THEO|nr:lantibiotic immunity ABC transporter MutG family permease subunit [Aceticella autotrophica]QSZ27438.1 lantibiotic immunity ABC transporter MutG family permease subunit [Aceticella autotrophica]